MALLSPTVPCNSECVLSRVHMALLQVGGDLADSALFVRDSMLQQATLCAPKIPPTISKAAAELCWAAGRGSGSPLCPLP
jgi:hypothetical protein